MSDWKVVSISTHANKRWQRPNGLLHAARDAFAPVVAQEVPIAMMSMALAFMENNGKHQPVAIQGFRDGQNKFVHPDDGRWLGEYIPALYRVYPFRIARTAEGAEALCVDEDAARVTDEGEGERFFTEDGKPAPAIAGVLAMLAQFEKERRTTDAICALLTRMDLFEPWTLRVQDGDEVVDVGGLLRISETKLYKIDAAALVELRDAGALTLAYGQLFSMQQVHQIGKLHAAARKPQMPSIPPVKLGADNGLISFENL